MTANARRSTARPTFRERTTTGYHLGDVVWFPPGEKHWHGAMPGVAMAHIAIVEALDGKSADWLEKVSDEQYQAAAKSPAE